MNRFAPIPLRAACGAAPARWIGPIALGMLAVLAHNRRLWRRDLALVERLRAERAAMPALAHTPRVSVLVAAWDEGPRIEAHIRSFLALRYPAIELVICAGGADHTYERALALAGPTVTVLRQEPGEGKQRALARCLARASGELLYLTDADCRYDDEALVRLLAPLVAGESEAATGASRPLDEQLCRVLPRHLWAADVASDARRPAASEGILGRNAAVTRRAIERIGGLDYPAPTGTDYQLAKRLLRAGVGIRFVRESVVATGYPETLEAYRRKQSRWLRNLLLYGPRYGARHEVAATRRTIAVGAGLLALPLAGLRFLPALQLWLVLLLHGSLARLRYARVLAALDGRPVGWRHALALPALTLADMLAWASPLWDLLSPRRRNQW